MGIGYFKQSSQRLITTLCRKTVCVCWLTQVNAIQMCAPLLRHIHIYIEEDHWVPKVLPRAWIQHQHGIMGRGARKRLLVSEWTFSSVQHLAHAVTAPWFGAHHPTWGVRQDGQNFVWVSWRNFGKTEEWGEFRRLYLHYITRYTDPVHNMTCAVKLQVEFMTLMMAAFHLGLLFFPVHDYVHANSLTRPTGTFHRMEPLLTLLVTPVLFSALASQHVCWESALFPLWEHIHVSVQTTLFIQIGQLSCSFPDIKHKKNIKSLQQSFIQSVRKQFKSTWVRHK